MKFSRGGEANCVCVCVCVHARTRTHMLRLESRPILCGLIVEFKGANRKRGRNEAERGQSCREQHPVLRGLNLYSKHRWGLLKVSSRRVGLISVSVRSHSDCGMKTRGGKVRGRGPHRPPLQYSFNQAVRLGQRNERIQGKCLISRAR